MKVLCLIDGSDASARAFRFALSSLRVDGPSGASSHQNLLTVVTFVEPVDMSFAHGKPYYEELEKDLNEEAARKGKKLLAHYEHELSALGVPHNAIVMIGDKKQQLLRLVDEEEYDCVVLGRRGMTVGERLVQGSFSEFATRHVQTNVIICK